MMWMVKLVVHWLALRMIMGQETIELEIPQGKLIGLKNTSVYHGVPFYSFRGIPYAEPNVGRDKFKVAVPLNSWSGVLDATKHGNSCACLTKTILVGNEDCLFLNVYTPDLNPTANRAVMVFIHGGAFYFGSGDDWWYGPDFLIEKDVVIVTINYRLGIIGFLNTGTANAPGNVGLKDQNLALKWVQKNIINFSGSPDRVTIFGQSAGSASVQYHILSPMSKGLFQKAIMQSGSSTNPWAFTRSPQANLMLLAKILGIDVSNMAFLDMLKDTSLEKLLLAAREDLLPKTMGLFSPSVEVDVGQEIFLPDDPWKILTSGDISDVPIMVGVTGNEIGLMPVTKGLALPFPQLRGIFGDLIPINFNMTGGRFNFDGLLGQTNSLDIDNLWNDLLIVNGVLFTAGIMNARMSSPVYQYLFNFNTSSSVVKHLVPIASGVAHCDELGLLFHGQLLHNVPEPGSLEEQKTNEMVDMWTNFAKTGDPSASMEAAKIKWEPMSDDKKYLEIGHKLEMKNSLFEKRLKYWSGIYSEGLGEYVKLFN